MSFVALEAAVSPCFRADATHPPTLAQAAKAAEEQRQLFAEFVKASRLIVALRAENDELLKYQTQQAARITELEGVVASKNAEIQSARRAMLGAPQTAAPSGPVVTTQTTVADHQSTSRSPPAAGPSPTTLVSASAAETSSVVPCGQIENAFGGHAHTSTAPAKKSGSVSFTLRQAPAAAGQADDGYVMITPRSARPSGSSAASTHRPLDDPMGTAGEISSVNLSRDAAAEMPSSARFVDPMATPRSQATLRMRCRPEGPVASTTFTMTMTPRGQPTPRPQEPTATPRA
jgi:hypothetical protein